MNKCYEADLYRYYGRKETFIEYITRTEVIKYIVLLRKTQGCKSKILKTMLAFRLRKRGEKAKIEISHTTSIGKGFYIGHCGPVIINPNAVIGENVNVATGVTIGQENRGKRKGAPTICNQVWIGTNAVVVGKINIGDDVLIAPSAYVNFDVPSHSIVIGNPATIVSRENATDGYINKRVH